MLSLDSVLFAFQLFEKGLIPFSATRHRPREKLVAELLSVQALQPAGFASHIFIPARDGDIDVEIEVDTEKNLAWYKCPETHKRRSVPLDEARLLQISQDWIKTYLCEGLGMPAHHRRMQLLEHDALWYLGSAVIDRAQTNIYLARSMKTRCDSIVQKLHSQPTPPSAIVISLNAPPVASVAIPANTHLAMVDMLYVTGETGARINLPYLEFLLGGSTDGMSLPESYLKRQGNSIELCLRGRKEAFSGIQADIITLLWEHRDFGSGLSWKEIADKTHSGARGIDDAMGGKSKRELWIETVSRGRFRLKSA